MSTQQVESVPECPELSCTRRRLLGGAGALAGLGALELAAPQMAFAAAGKPRGDLLVVVSLRGGADGLSLVPPLGDGNYLKNRPTIGLNGNQALHLNRSFGLHAGLKPLLPYWTDKRLAIVHAVGDSDGTRSHFEATDAMERGVNAKTSVSTGWIDRHLVARGLRKGEFPAVAIGSRAPGTLLGGAPTVTFGEVSTFKIAVAAAQQARTAAAFAQMYRGVASAPADAARETLDALGRVAPFRDKPYVPRAGVTYTNDGLGYGLKQIAEVARAGVGLEVATVDADGWDTHEGMGNGSAGYMANLVANLGKALAAFAHDLGPLLANTTIVTVSEFGRRVGQNGSDGVDHGHGSAMLVLGGGINGGKVYGRWPGLAEKQLDNGDLAVTSDYRDVLGEIVHRRLGGAANLSTVFPDHRPRELGLAKQR